MARSSRLPPETLQACLVDVPHPRSPRWRDLAKTPRPIIDLLNRHLNSILREPETRATFLAQGYDPAGGSPEDFHRVLAGEVATWSRVIRAADIRFE